MVINPLQLQLLEPVVVVTECTLASRFRRLKAKLVGHVLLAVRMEIDPSDGACDLVEAYVVESLETCTTDLSYSVIGNQELLLPSHEHVLAAGTVLVLKVVFLCLCR